VIRSFAVLLTLHLRRRWTRTPLSLSALVAFFLLTSFPGGWLDPAGDPVFYLLRLFFPPSFWQVLTDGELSRLSPLLAFLPFLHRSSKLSVRERPFFSLAPPSLIREAASGPTRSETAPENNVSSFHRPFRDSPAELWLHLDCPLSFFGRATAFSHSRFFLGRTFKVSFPFLRLTLVPWRNVFFGSAR